MKTHTLPDCTYPAAAGCPRRKYIRDLARSNRLMVSFHKNNGELREMMCTLNPNEIPQEHQPKNSTVIDEDGLSPLPLRVYDLEKNGWRSFWSENVITVVEL